MGLSPCELLGRLRALSVWASVWGTAGQWVSAFITTLTVVAAAGYYIYDKVTDRKAQAMQVVNGNRNLTSWRQLNIDQLGFIGRRP
jgi:hypothetical protein